MNGGRRWMLFAIDSDQYAELAQELVSDHGFEEELVPTEYAPGRTGTSG